MNSFALVLVATASPPLTPISSQHHSNHTEGSLLCTEDEVYHLLLTLEVTKYNGPDGNSPTMLKHTADIIASSLTELFNLCTRLSQLPPQWKHTLIMPVPKSSSTGSPSCNCPISLLPIVSKSLKEILY